MVVMQRELDRSVRRTLQRLLGWLAALLLLTALAFLVSSWRQQASLQTVFDDRVVPLHDLQRLSQRLNIELPAVLASPVVEPAELSAVEARVEELWAKYLQTYLTEQEKELVARVQQRKDALLGSLRPSASARPVQERYAQALHPFNHAMAPLLELQVKVAETEMRAAAHWSWVGLALALVCGLAAWALVVHANRVVRDEVVLPLRIVADAVAELSGPVPSLGPEAQGLSGDFAEVGEQLQRLRVSLEERRSLQLRTESLLAQLRSAQGELVEAEKLASLGKLVAGVSHELNTPLGVAVAVSSGLSAKAQAFQAELQAGGLKRSVLDAMLSAIDEATGLLDRNLARAAELLRSFKQVAVDRSGMQRRRFDLGQTLDELLTSLRPVYGRDGVVLRNEVPAGIELDGYPGPLGQVVNNLVANAVLHGFQGGDGRPMGGQVRLALHARDAQGLDLLVEDDGVGMDEEVRAHAFDPFFTTKLGQGGSGLGLAIVHSLVVGGLGGRIQLQSAPGQGSRFVIHLPLVAPQTQAVKPAPGSAA